MDFASFQKFEIDSIEREQAEVQALREERQGIERILRLY
jgi:hypothetical protein